MRIGFITDLSEEDFKFAAENGIPCVEFYCSDDINVLINSKDQIKRYMEEYGVEFTTIALFGRNHISQDVNEREKHHDDAKALMDIAADLGAPTFFTSAGHAEDRDLNTNCGLAVDALGSLVEYGKKIGVKVALYNCHWGNFAFAPDSWEILHKEVPDLGIKYDPSHCFYDGRDYLKEARDWGHRFYHVHAKGSLMIDGKRFEDPPAGMDQTNWGALMAVLYHHNYEGDIVIEPHAKTWLGARRHAGIRIAARHLEQFVF